jgi:phospholipid transport system transporter-binding protein
MNQAAAVRRDGDVLRVTGRLDRTAVAALWSGLQPLLPGARRVDVSAVDAVDSAGLALLVELAANGLGIKGDPPGLAELGAAYRLDAALAYSR